jgi:hypothetical protein
MLLSTIHTTEKFALYVSLVALTSTPLFLGDPASNGGIAIFLQASHTGRDQHNTGLVNLTADGPLSSTFIEPDLLLPVDGSGVPRPMAIATWDHPRVETNGKQVGKFDRSG